MEGKLRLLMMLKNIGLDRRDLLVVIVLFAAARAVYALLGLHFDASTLSPYMQFIDVELLSTRLLESLWYYHANPPLLNLLAGIGLKLFGTHAGDFFSVVFHALGLLTALCIYVLTLRLSSSRAAGYVTTGLLVFSPAFVLYENWLMYTFPSVALLTLSAVALYMYVRTARTGWCAAFFCILAALLLTRSLFHLAWMIAVVALLTIVLWDRRRQVLLAAVLPALVVTLWYGKNYYYFGTFSSSTWLGLGLSNISTLAVTQEELKPLVDDHRLSRWALVSRYRQTDLLFNSQRLAATGIPVLDQVRKSTGEYNWNNRQIVALDRSYIADAITVIRVFPASYVICLVISNRLYFSPSSMNLYFAKENRRAVQPMERIFNPLLYGAATKPALVQQPHFGFQGQNWLEVNTSVRLVMTWWVLLAYGYMRARRDIVASAVAAESKAGAVVVGFIVFTALYLYVVSTAFELAENYRYRYLIEPLMFVLAAAAIADLVRWVRSRMRAR